MCRFKSLLTGQGVQIFTSCLLVNVNRLKVVVNLINTFVRKEMLLLEYLVVPQSFVGHSFQ